MVAFSARFNPKISDLRHRLALCSMQDVVEKDGTMELSRKEIAWTWGWIMGQQTVPSFLTPYGYPFGEKFDRVTHRIMVRGGLALDYTSAAWVYETRRVGVPRWYKVVGQFDYERWVFLNVHLQERSEDAQPPVGGLRPLQSKVTL